MIEKLIAAMTKAYTDAEKSGLCQGYMESYRDDFLKFDVPRLQAEAMKGMRWVWVLTPSGTNLSMYGINAKSNEWASAILHSGYSDIKVYRIDGFSLYPWTKQSAEDEVTRHERYKVNGSAVVCDNQMIATFDTKMAGTYEKRSHEFHFKTESKVVEKLHLIGMRELAIQLAVCKEGTLFVKISSITVNGKNWETLMDAYNGPKVVSAHQEELMLV